MALVAETVNEYRAHRDDPASLSECVRLLQLGIIAMVEAQVAQTEGPDAVIAGMMAFGVMAKNFDLQCQQAVLRLVQRAKGEQE